MISPFNVNIFVLFSDFVWARPGNHFGIQFNLLGFISRSFERGQVINSVFNLISLVLFSDFAWARPGNKFGIQLNHLGVIFRLLLSAAW